MITITEKNCRIIIPKFDQSKKKWNRFFFNFFFGPNHRFFGYSHYYSVKKRNKTKKKLLWFETLWLPNFNFNFCFYFLKKNKKIKWEKNPNKNWKSGSSSSSFFYENSYSKWTNNKNKFHENVEKRTAWSSSACKDKRKNLQKKKPKFLPAYHHPYDDKCRYIIYDIWIVMMMIIMMTKFQSQINCHHCVIVKMNTNNFLFVSKIGQFKIGPFFCSCIHYE